MKHITKIPTVWYCSSIVLFLLFAKPLTAEQVYVCVWRNPERTMSRLFPDARDYRTVALPLSAEKRDRIEERTGEEILPGQREEYQYYEMLNRDGVVIGYTQAVTQRGEFGAIEFVFGMDTTHTINTIYIQRARERDRTFRQDEFLETFVGLGIEGIDTLEDPAGEDATIATTGVTVGVRKALVSFEELVLAD